jgi:AraC family transcriptional regulator
VADLILSETCYSPGSRLPRHSHENAYLCLVRQGSYSETYGGRTRTCGPMTVAFHPPEELHEESFHDEPVLSFNVELTARWLHRLRDHSALLERAPHFDGGPHAFLVLRLYREFQAPDGLSPLAVEGLMLEMAAEACRRSQPDARRNKPRWLEQTRELLHARFHEPMTLAEIAAGVGVHPVYLASVFRRHYRSSVGEYVRRLRIEFASRRLGGAPRRNRPGRRVRRPKPFLPRVQTPHRLHACRLSQNRADPLIVFKDLCFVQELVREARENASRRLLRGRGRKHRRQAHARQTDRQADDARHDRVAVRRAAGDRPGRSRPGAHPRQGGGTGLHGLGRGETEGHR